MALLISGIGRSGTTTLYQILGQAYLSRDVNARCIYEPYLWDIPEVEKTAKVKHQPFNTSQLGPFNIYVHCNTPLILHGRHELNDAWLNRIFGPSRTAKKNVLAKIIRGSGRLEAALTKYDNLKVVIVTRNVVDTVNSGLGLFSFFGDEFHRSDKNRFIDEVNHHFNELLDRRTIENEIMWSVLWWHYFSDISLKTFVKFPKRVMIVPYEKYVENKLEEMKKIFQFAGIEEDYLEPGLFDKSAGPMTKVSYLTTQNIEQMNDELHWYFNNLRMATDYDVDADKFRRDCIEKYNKRKYVQSLCLSEATDLTVVQWRLKYKDKLLEEKNSEVKIKNNNQIAKNISVESAYSLFGLGIDATDSSEKIKLQTSIKLPNKKSIGVLITCYNNEETIEESLKSVLNQTRRPDLIVVADDCSSDASLNVIEKVAPNDKQLIKIITRSENLGVATNRELAIRDMDTDYITTLDGDDLYFPQKIELESNALDGRVDRVAFSDIAVIRMNNHFIQKTEPYSNKSKKEMFLMLASRSVPVPRDMMFSKNLFEKTGGFDVGLDIYEDWSFKMRLIESSGDYSWTHSGGTGTIYNRMVLGLSGRKAVTHAYGQLLALSSNTSILMNYPDALISGLRTCSKHLSGNTKLRFDTIVSRIADGADFDFLALKLKAFWDEASFSDDIENQYLQLWRFSSLNQPIV